MEAVSRGKLLLRVKFSSGSCDEKCHGRRICQVGACQCHGWIKDTHLQHQGFLEWLNDAELRMLGMILNRNAAEVCLKRSMLLNRIR